MKKEALEKLFSIDPYSRLITGTHCSVYARPGEGLSGKDDINHVMHLFSNGAATYDEVMKLAQVFMPVEDHGILDIEVNGKEFALTYRPFGYSDGEGRKIGTEFSVVARHRLTKEASAEFSTSLHITVPFQ